MSHRIKRINQILKQELSYLIKFNLKDPRLNDMVSITKVNTTGDLRYAKVYVSIYDKPDKQKEIMDVLNKAAGYLRRNIGKKINAHFTPELIFELDDSIEYGLYINDILKKINPEEINTDDNGENN